MASRADAALAQAELGAEQSTRRLTLVVTAGSALALLIAGVAVVRAVRDVRTLQQAGIELALARDRAESADRVKSSFLASMSHELRTPLNSIIGFTGLLLQGLPGPLNEEQRKQLGMVRTSAQHLLALINDVLDISKIEAGELRIANAAFDVRAVIERAVASVRGRAQAKGLEIGVQVADGVGPMTGDARRVEQILLNLLSNALKFTDAGRITLSAALLPAEPTVRPMVRIAVSDTGRGIRPDDLPRLFRPFEQIDSGLARDHEGTGLGLSISQRLAGLLGGAITVDSRWQQGSVFTLTLPQYLESPT
jgi:signal transduction histidine kinase